MPPTMPASTSPPARRIFPIGDWAPAHEALYPEADNDSSIDTLPFPRKHGESSASASVPSPLAPLPRRSNTTAAKHRSMSLPWRPKSTIITVDDLDARVADLSLQRSRTAADPSSVHQHEPDAEPSTPPFEFGPHNNKGKGKKKMSGLFRRASVSIKGFVIRRTTIATDTLDDSPELRLRRQLRSSHAPSQTHHMFNTNIFAPSSPASPTSPASSSTSPLRHTEHSPRAPTGHAINATWHRLRKATSTSFRHSRILVNGVPYTSHEQPYLPPDDLSSPFPRPGLGHDPPIIPRNSGSGARAAVAAWQQDVFPTTLPIRNKRLTVDSAQNDRESGIGIAVTSTGSMADDAHDLDMVTAEGEVVLGGCAPSRVDFIQRLPAELAIQVLAHLDASGLATASLVSKNWRDIVSTQHIWRESYLREKTGTYATSAPIVPGTGHGIPMIQPNIDWKDAYRATEELAKRWKQGKATSIYLNGHSDSIYCLQFDEYVYFCSLRPPSPSPPPPLCKKNHLYSLDKISH